ncbi:hydrolase 1, exosortase A system-associated [Thalassotalea sp. 1_MG-2023]|uniref:hydrolase 1, exosortase A system-associated n=1 Tax=Thalassotalea sp. 1_MG-2023 TaxID=3062680 RepID=UPI0026E488C6|nr:hydrolase 1, exosortase A system-associated [Thalassotalea sp. 1_MG-2023]MDO6425512.1 hydrolase 1, exosortase A system-associated [Thalassotalea sp. 1_MG-2023]
MQHNQEIPVSFKSGEAHLHGILHQVEHAKQGVIMVVGGPQTRVGSHRMFVQIARYLASQGVSVLRFDYRGAGDSDGEIQSFQHTVGDISAAVRFFNRQYPKTNIALWGLCDAASAIALFLKTEQVTSINHVVLLNPWVKQPATEAQAYLSHYYWHRLRDISFWKKLITGKLNIFRSAQGIAEQKTLAKQQQEGSFVDGMLAGLQQYTGQSHLILAEQDLTAQEFCQLRTHNAPWKKLNFSSEIIIAGANHTFASPRWKQQVAEQTFNAIISS